ncbi:MAG: phenylacetate--CoA ligase family protein [Acetobacteraceae bacterium]
MNYFEAMDLSTLQREYPIGEAFLAHFRHMSSDELRALQERRFAAVMTFAWTVPFYRRHWGSCGIAPADIRGLEDIGKLPTYSKADLMQSLEAHPPLGDFHGLDSYTADRRPPLIFHTTSGTTGKPQPVLFGPWSREVQNRLLARTWLLQGMRADDVVHSVYGFGTVNGGHYIRESVLHWIGAQLITAGTGVETRSAQQVALMRDFGATILVGFGDYIKRLSEVARESGIIPGRDIRLRMISGLIGPGTAAGLGAAWGGCPAYDWYGVADTGLIAGECPARCGLHVMEDAQWIELCDPDTGAAVPAGAPGDVVCTSLFRHDVYPIIRFNTHDVTREIPGDSPIGLPFRRITGFEGRSDNMIKLRGINVYPTAIGPVLEAECPGFTGEFLAEVTRDGSRDEMTVLVEVRNPPASDSLEARLEQALRASFGVMLRVRLAAPGSLAARTGLEHRQKPIRLVDRRSE